MPSPRRSVPPSKSMLKTPDTCADCRFYVKADTDKGTCHRLPPVPLLSEPFGVFPAVYGTEWCGEFK
jgi:hypothetical protein